MESSLLSRIAVDQRFDQVKSGRVGSGLGPVSNFRNHGLEQECLWLSVEFRMLISFVNLK